MCSFHLENFDAYFNITVQFWHLELLQTPQVKDTTINKIALTSDASHTLGVPRSLF